MSFKIFRYEARRILLGRLYLCLLVAGGAYALFLLKTQVLQGTGGTAPYSPWSFGAYLLTLSPLFNAVLLFYIAQLFGKEQRDVMRLTSATPFPPGRYQLLKIAAVFSAWTLCVLVACLLCFGFYEVIFGSFAMGPLVGCLLLILLPQLMLLSGAGLWLGRLHLSACYGLIALVFFVALARIALPPWADVIGFSLLTDALRTIPDKGVIPFVVPGPFLVSRVVFFLVGCMLVGGFCGLGRGKRK